MNNLPPGVTVEDCETNGQGWPRCHHCGRRLTEDEESREEKVCGRCEADGREE